MSLTETEKQNMDYYNRSGLGWSMSHNDKTSIWGKEIAIFMDFLPGGDVVEIGPGVGNEAEILLKTGKFKYTGVDLSFTLARIAKARNPLGNFINASVYDLPAINKKFDGFVGLASYLHIPKNRIDEALQITRNSLHPAGYGVMSMKEGQGEKVDPETGRTFSYYDMGEFYNILRKNGFGIVRSYARNINEKLTWLNYYVQKR